MKLYGISYQSDEFNDEHRMGFITCNNDRTYSVSLYHTQNKELFHVEASSLKEATNIVIGWIDFLSIPKSIALKGENNA